MRKYEIRGTPDGTAVVRLSDGYEALFSGEGGTPPYASSQEEAEEVIGLLLSGETDEGDYDWFSPSA